MNTEERLKEFIKILMSWYKHYVNQWKDLRERVNEQHPGIFYMCQETAEAYKEIEKCNFLLIGFFYALHTDADKLWITNLFDFCSGQDEFIEIEYTLLSDRNSVGERKTITHKYYCNNKGE